MLTLRLSATADNSATLNAAIASVSAAGGGAVFTSEGPARMSRPIIHRPNVRLVGQGGGTRFTFDYSMPGILAIPQAWTRADSLSGGFAPSTDSDGLILGKGQIQGYLRWDDVSSRRQPVGPLGQDLDGVYDFGLDLLYAGGDGQIAGWGGRLLTTESLGKIIIDIVGGCVRLSTHDGNGAGCVSGSLGNGWHTIRASVDHDGVPLLTVDGVDYTHTGSPSEVTSTWCDNLYFGARSGEWEPSQSYPPLASGRIKNCYLRSSNTSWIICRLTDCDGPITTYRNHNSSAPPVAGEANAGVISLGLLSLPSDADPVSGWTVENVSLDTQGGRYGIFASNAQNTKIDRCTINAAIGVHFEHNVYSGEVRDCFIPFTHVGISLLNNGGQNVPVTRCTLAGSGGGRCGFLAINSFNYALVDTWIYDILPGGVGGLFGSFSTGVWNRVSFYNEGSNAHYANVVARGLSNGFRDCLLIRGGAGPIFVLDGGPGPLTVSGGISSPTQRTIDDNGDPTDDPSPVFLVNAAPLLPAVVMGDAGRGTPAGYASQPWVADADAEHVSVQDAP